ncbi:beta-N-acetylhexosaminidase [Salimicrobium humidisoli]|uniref:beta-N-acetylhexosaminidase n=1 Tax=Salimicrobium humidisoli TaxID=2029857 RepID=A0ABX4HR08_9BACI|nr:beta-N-acetylhexosaminidase [Salimicrobium humidisoli]PBB05525.1 beta-N-acetylhexosaminidase [Salimicrobium humidisoli]
MRKRMGIIIGIIVLGLSVFLIFGNERSEPGTGKEQGTSENENGEAGGRPAEIFSRAEKGEVPGVPFTVGETTREEVREKWGEPEETTDEKGETVLDYSSRNVKIGLSGDTVTMLKSDRKEESSFGIDDVKSHKKPDRTENKGSGKDQTLVYALSGGRVLEFVFPRSDDEAKKTEVDYVTLSAGAKEASDTKISNMSLDEKIGQMIFGGVSGTGMNEETKEVIEKYHVGGLILFGNNITSAPQTVDFLNEMKQVNENNPYPLLLGVDEEGGRVSRMPPEVTKLPPGGEIGELEDPELAFKTGEILGAQMNELGFNLDFAPVLDVNSNPDNPVIGDRSFSSDPETVSELGIQVMKGIEEQGVVPVIKHFPGHGDTSVDSHLNLPKVTKSYEELKQMELIPFKQAIEAGADVTMTSHILLPAFDDQYPASMSEAVITDVLRDDLGFEGVVITDDLTMGAITNEYSVEDAAVETVKAGGDLLLMAHDSNLISTVFNELKAAVENGELSEARINESVERIADLKEKYQITGEETPPPDFQPLNRKVEEVLERVS